METNKPAVGNINLSNFFCREQIQHIHFVRCVENHIKLTAIYLKVIAHIAHLFYNIGILFRKNISRINSCAKIQKIECGFVAAHIAFVEQIYAGNICLRI